MPGGRRVTWRELQAEQGFLVLFLTAILYVALREPLPSLVFTFPVKY